METIEMENTDFSSPPKVISNGTIYNMKGEKVPYTLEMGLNKTSILECNEWRDFIYPFIIDFVEAHPEVEDYESILQNDIMLEDYHWNWLDKAVDFNTLGYDWFFLKTSDGVQGVCITFHPKKSAIKSVDIFYVQFLSSAPWNRPSSLHERRYKGIGTEILRQIQIYLANTYHYCYGFNLLSLPQARTFYEHIGMVNLKEYNHGDSLFFYEIDEDHVKSLLEERNA
jgi:hypothetical protein